MKPIIMGLLTMICSLFGCNAHSPRFESLSAEDYAKAIHDTAVVRLDVRTAEEFAAGHIDKAINIDVTQSDFEATAISSLPKDRTIAVNCRSGKRSKRAAEILVKNGFKVIELDSGFSGWVSAGFPISK